MADSGSKHSTDVLLNESNFEVLVAKFIPTSQYFERSFQMLQNQMNDFKEDQKELKNGINRRFEEVHQGQKDIRLEMDKRFEQVENRFEQVNKRFEQVDNRFDQVNAKLDTIIERMDVKIDAGLRETRSMSIRLFSFAMIFSAISMAGFLAKMTGLF